MFVKKVLAPAQERLLKKELEYLYHRRTTIEMLIRSLERYDRSRETRRVACQRNWA